ncbi:hypothetical protein [Parabacteroides sp.]|uniref:hypothetical protein n=1 Tax=Parabacteroides sp. TaxID=1869337 RepID=UPI0026DFD812|nr:hypothetical protein [Parabacteroides sp.]MDO5430540.1 hypothetical protein [Parabacteroides sp.]
MRIKNILAALFFLCIVASCSMEDDILSGVDTKVPDLPGTSEVYASVDLSLLAGKAGLATKGSSVTGPTEGTLADMTSSESSIYNCYIAIYENGETPKFVASHFYQGYDDDNVKATETNGTYTLGKHIIFKIPKEISERKDLKVVAVAQVSADADYFSSLSSIPYNNLMNKLLADQPNTLVKVGEKVLEKGVDGNYNSYVSISEKVLDLDKAPVHSPVEIPVYQRAAAVMLNSFVIKDKYDVPYDDVTITDVQLVNGKMYGKVEGEVQSREIGSGAYPAFHDTQSIRQIQIWQGTGYLEWENGGSTRFNEVMKGAESSTKDQYRLYSYENTDAVNKTSMRISYSYNNGETGSCEFTIKSRTSESSQNEFVEQVWAGYLYKLDVAIKNATVDVTVKCYTKNWIKNEIQVIEIVENGN